MFDPRRRPQIRVNIRWKRLKGKIPEGETSENFSKESNLPRRFRRYPEILQNPVKGYLLSSEKSSEISSANTVSAARSPEGPAIEKIQSRLIA